MELVVSDCCNDSSSLQGASVLNPWQPLGRHRGCAGGCAAARSRSAATRSEQRRPCEDRSVLPAEPGPARRWAVQEARWQVPPPGSSPPARSSPLAGAERCSEPPASRPSAPAASPHWILVSSQTSTANHVAPPPYCPRPETEPRLLGRRTGTKTWGQTLRVREGEYRKTLANRTSPFSPRQRRAQSTWAVLLHHSLQQLLPLQGGGMVCQVSHRWGDAGCGVATDTGTGGAEQNGNGRAVCRVEEGTVMVGGLPAESGCCAWKQH